jgi:hypothetical protein
MAAADPPRSGRSARVAPSGASYSSQIVSPWHRRSINAGTGEAINRAFIAAPASVLLAGVISCLLLVTTAGAVDAIKVLYAFGLHPALKDLFPPLKRHRSTR